MLQQHLNCERFDLSRGLFELCQLDYPTKNKHTTYICVISFENTIFPI